MAARLLPDDPADAALIAQVRPADWVNPSPRPVYDFVVLGAGTAGLVAAAGAAGVGASVALVERDLMGGDCLNVGCVPSKALIASARRVAAVRDAGSLGIRTSPPEADFAAVMSRLRGTRASLASHDSAKRFRDLGIDVFLGDGRFAGPDSLAVGGVTLRFRRAALCTGSRPAVPDVPGLAESGYLTNETLYALTELPPRLAVLGGGPIGCEMAQAFARLGSRVTLIVQGSRLLPRDVPDAAALVLESFRRDGIDVRLDAKLTHVKGKRLTLSSGVVDADALLVAVGRKSSVEGLGLDAAGVEVDGDKGVRADDLLRTTNRRIFVAGDALGGPQFTHAADATARTLVRNALFFGRGRLSRLVIPRVTYTAPEVAAVGTAEGRAFEIPLNRVDRAVLEGETDGYFRLYERNGRIVGATAVGANAGELIAPVTVAMQQGLTLKALSGMVLPYPTEAEAFRKAVDAWNKTRLTPTSAWLLRQVLRWRWW